MNNRESINDVDFPDCMKNDLNFRKKVIEIAVEYKGQALKHRIIKIKEFCQSLTIPGFRDALSQGARKKLINELSKRIEKSRTLFLSSVLIWCEVNLVLLEQVKKHLIEKGLSLSEDDDPEKRGGRDRDNILVSTEFHAKHPEYSQNDVELAVYSIIYDVVDPKSEEKQMTDEKKGLKQDISLPKIFQDLLTQLQTLPFESDEFQKVDDFIRLLRELGERKKQKAIKKSDKLNNLLFTFKKEKQVFEELCIEDSMNWKIEDFSQNNYEHIISELAELICKIIDFKSSKLALKKSAPEDRKTIRAQQHAIQNYIDKLFNQITNRITVKDDSGATIDSDTQEKLPQEEPLIDGEIRGRRKVVKLKESIRKRESEKPVDTSKIQVSETESSKQERHNDLKDENEAVLEIKAENVEIISEKLHQEAQEVTNQVSVSDLDQETDKTKSQTEELSGATIKSARRDFDLSTPINECAQEIKSIENKNEKLLATKHFFWRLTAESDLEKALHVLKALHFMGNSHGIDIPGWLFEAATISKSVSQNVGPLAERLKYCFTQFNEHNLFTDDKEWNHAIRFILVAACIRPALIAPSTNAWTALSSVQAKDGLNRFFDYCRLISEFGSTFNPINPILLKDVKGKANLENEKDKLMLRVFEWKQKASASKTRFGVANRLWRLLLNSDQLIGQLVGIIQSNNTKKVSHVKQIVEEYSDDKTITSFINSTVKNQLKGPNRSMITGPARAHLINGFREIIGYGHQWTMICESEENKSETWGLEKINELSQKINGLSQDVADEINQFIDKYRDFDHVVASGKLLLNAMNDISSLFSPQVPFDAKEFPINFCLNKSLLGIDRVNIEDDSLNPDYSKDKEKILSGILNITASGEDWESYYYLQCEAKDHYKTEQIIEYLTLSNPNLPLIEKISIDRQKSLIECEFDLRKDIDNTRQDVTKALSFGLMGDKEVEEILNRLSRFDNSLAAAGSKILNFNVVHEKLKQIRNQINKIRTKKIDGLKKEFNSLKIQKSSSEYTLINTALDKRDFLAAEEYIEKIRSGERLPEIKPSRDVFSEFFPSELKEVERLLKDKEPKKLISALKASRFRDFKETFFNSIRHLPNPHIKTAAETLDSWFTIKRRINVEEREEDIERILRFLGFIPENIKIVSEKFRSYAIVKTERISDKLQCPVPEFGSYANGDYHIHFIWGRPIEDDVVSEISKFSVKKAVLVFYFGRLEEKMRKDLAIISQEQKKTFLTLDDIVLTYLCREPGQRLPLLFDLLLPFAYVAPYTTTAGMVPEEMFYGREEEIQSVLSPRGSCFIYGGRQLGKTALLRHAESKFHSPEETKFAFWIDLKVEGIGFDLELDEIWKVLMVKCQKVGIIPKNLRSTQAGRVTGEIEKWLEKNEQHQILILFDEADRFLESDGKEHFSRTAALKGLMDKTNRRFKVVFAGLHNVQRSTRVENNPLAHYGDPICIGPLLENKEWTEAQNLIEKPISAVGFRFSSPNLITRILSQTNYYPSLIQLYCKQLLRHLYDVKTSTSNESSQLPYIIESDHLEDAYQNNDLRDNIKNRFIWTLDLDLRYRIIALVIAHQAIMTQSDQMADVSIEWIRKQVMAFWPQGFKESSTQESLRILLEEMIGLGVLRQNDNQEYGLRNPNLLLMIGTEDEILNQLLSFADQHEMPSKYEAASFRPASKSKETLYKRNPLTSLQESNILSSENQISVIVGNESGGLKDVFSFLSYKFDRQSIFLVDTINDKIEFQKQVINFIKKSDQSKLLIYVSNMCPWNEQWFDVAREICNRRRIKTVAVIFIADPLIIWRYADDDSGFSFLKREKITTIEPWHDIALRQWLEENGIDSTNSAREQIYKITGNWPSLLYRLLKVYNKKDFEQTIYEVQQVFSNPDEKSKILKEFGIENPSQSNILKTLHEIGPLSIEDLVIILEDTFNSKQIYHTVRWADELNLIWLSGDDSWTVNEALGSFL
jgi:hypothetical protein